MKEITLRKDSSSVESIQKAAYRLAPRAVVILEQDIGDDLHRCSIKVKLDDDADELADELRQLVNDYFLREHLSSKTEAVRSLLFAQAFPSLDDEE